MLLPETIEFASETIPYPISDWSDINLSALIVYPFSAPEKCPLKFSFVRSIGVIEIAHDAVDVTAVVPSTVVVTLVKLCG